MLNRDLRGVEHLAVREVAADRPVHEVDRHPLEVLSDRTPLWIGGNWIVIAVLAAVFPTETLVMAGLAVGLLIVATIRTRYGRPLPTIVAAVVLSGLGYGTLVIDPLLNEMAAGLVALLCLVAGMVLVRSTLEARNEAMLEEIAELAADHEYERVCLATGYAHLPGLVERASAHGLTTVDVFEPQWRSSGQVSEPNAVLESDETAVRPRMETAGTVLVRRALATGIDWFVIGLVGLAGAVALVGIDETYSIGSDTFMGGLILVGWLLLPPAYYVLGDAVYERTVGRSILGLTVVRIDGSPCTVGDAVRRTALLPIDFLPLGFLLGGAVAYSTGYGQRLGDLAAGTTVVKCESVDVASPADDSRATGEPRAVTGARDHGAADDDRERDDGPDTDDDERNPRPHVPRIEPDDSTYGPTVDR